MSKTSQTKRLQNVSYLFVPFNIKEHRNSLRQIVEKSEYWEEKNTSYKYFLRYIEDKLSPQSNTYCIQQYTLLEDKRKEMGIIDQETSCYMYAKKSNESGHPFSFKINEIKLYIFDTNIGILAFKIIHPLQDSWGRVATKCYHLKKVYTAKLFTKNNFDKGLITKEVVGLSTKTINNLSELSEYILFCTDLSSFNLFFNYTSVIEQRCNILTHYGLKINKELEQEEIAEVKKMLFYLRRNYYSKWTYDGKKDLGKENYSPSEYIHWGITSEGTACVTIMDLKENFVSNSFQKNFHSYYLMMYVLCLHQKFALYLYLSIFNDDLQNKVGVANDYLKELAKFRAKYVFAVISESETYQTVYEKTRQAFGLDQLLNDIEEQAKRVLEIQNLEKEIDKEKKGRRNDIALGLLAFLCVFSAIVDLRTIVADMEYTLGAEKVYFVQQIGSVTIILIGVVLMLLFLTSVKKPKAKPFLNRPIKSNKRKGKKRNMH